MTKWDWLSSVMWLSFVGYASYVFDVHFFTWRGLGLYGLALIWGFTERLVGRERA